MNYAIWVTTKCNMSCIYCYEGKEKANLVLSKEKADQIINYILENEKDKSREINITYHGGEPLLEFKIMRYITQNLECKLKGRQVYFSTTTNGTILDKEIMKFLSQYRFEMSISIDGGRETHNLYRKFSNGQGSYDVVIKNSKILLEKFPEMRVRMTYNENTLQDLAQNIYSLIKIGFKTIVPIHDFCESVWSDKHIEILREQIAIVKKYTNKYQVSVGVCEPLDVSCHKRCNGGITSINILPDGKIYPCMAAVGSKEFEMGNIETGIDEYKLKAIHEEFDREIEECLGCSFYSYCDNTHCRIMNRVFRGSYDKPSEIVCSLNNLFYKVNGVR